MELHQQQQMKMEEYPSFMTCILRIDISAHKWQRTMDKLLENVQVTNCRMNKDGMVEISGSVYPNRFLKKLKKAGKKGKAELCHFQFGECSTNLFLPSRPLDYGIPNKYGGPNNMLISSLIGQKEAQPVGYYGGRDGRFLHYGDKPSQLKKPKDSSKEKAHHDHDHDHNHNHVHDRNHNHIHGRDHNHNHVHGHDHNHNHNHNHVHGHDHDHGQGHSHAHGERDYKNHDQLLHVDGGQRKHERKLEHAAGCINATTPRPKVQLDCEKQMKGRAKPLKSQGVNSCCLM